MIGTIGTGRRDVPAPPRPGLGVSLELSAALDGEARVEVVVTGASTPIRLYLYLDGDLLDATLQEDRTYEYVLAVPEGRHVLTARVVDVRGRWGGASDVVELPAF